MKKIIFKIAVIILLIMKLMQLSYASIGPNEISIISGDWTTYQDNLQAINKNSNALILLKERHKGNTTIEFTISDQIKNAYTIFDYINENDFKYAGINNNQLVIGQYDGKWKNSITRKENIKPDTKYKLKIELSNGKVVINFNNRKKLQKDFPLAFNDNIGLGIEKTNTVFENLTIISKFKESQSRLPQVYTIEKTNTGLDEMLTIVENDKGLVNVPQIDIQEANYHANEMNKVIIDTIKELGLTNDEKLTPLEIKILNKYISDKYLKEWVIAHGDDEALEETGFHLVQHDGSKTKLFRRNAINTVIDGIDHLGYPIKFPDNLQNEDGNKNQKYSDVANWLEYFLKSDMENLKNENVKLDYNLIVKSGEIAIISSNTFLFKNSQDIGIIILQNREEIQTENIKFEMELLEWEKEKNGFVIFDYNNENDFKYIGIDNTKWVIGQYNGNFNHLKTLDDDIIPNARYQIEIKLKNNKAQLFVNNYNILEYQFQNEIKTQIGFTTKNAVTIFSKITINEKKVIEEKPLIAPTAINLQTQEIETSNEQPNSQTIEKRSSNFKYTTARTFRNNPVLRNYETTNTDKETEIKTTKTQNEYSNVQVAVVHTYDSRKSHTFSRSNFVAK